MTSQQNGDRERNLGDVFDDALELAKAQQEYIDKQAQIIELYEKMEVELRRRISLLEEEISLLKNVALPKGFEEPCRSCARWEPKA